MFIFIFIHFSIFIFLETSSLIHVLFRKVLFSFKHLEAILATFLLPISEFEFIFVTEHNLYGFSSFTGVKVCFLAQDMVYLGEYFMGT